MKVIIVAYNQFELLQMEIEALRLLAGIEERDLIIVDNGSEDGLRQWLEERPGMNYLICDEGGESYSAIVNLSLIHISEPTRQAEISYAVFCLKKKNKDHHRSTQHTINQM